MHACMHVCMHVDARLELRAGDPQLAPDPDAARGYAGGFAYL